MNKVEGLEFPPYAEEFSKVPKVGFIPSENSFSCFLVSEIEYKFHILFKRSRMVESILAL